MYLTAWGRSEWLKDVVPRYAAEASLLEEPVQRTAARFKLPKPVRDDPWIKSLSALEENLARQSQARRGVEAAESRLRDEFVLRVKQPYGRLDGDTMNSIVPIEPGFWPGATLHSSRNAATNGLVIYTDIRVGSCEVESLIGEEPASPPPVTPTKIRRKPGPKSEEMKIRETIKHCSETVKGWDIMNLSQRYFHYKRYLTIKLGVRSFKKFSAKTFEKFEGKM